VLLREHEDTMIAADRADALDSTEGTTTCLEQIDDDVNTTPIHEVQEHSKKKGTEEEVKLEQVGRSEYDVY
jgi:hypothetical protein